MASLRDGASPFGIFDLSGNAEEWMGDAEDAGRRVTRGGSWSSRDPEQLRLDRESRRAPDDVGQWVGFRCAADLPAGAPAAP